MADTRQILTILGMVCLLFFGIPIRVDKTKTTDTELREKLFLKYVITFNKSYRHNTTEYHRRFEAFQDSLDLIEELNRNRTSNSSAWYGLTQFSDLDFNEFNKVHLKNNHEKVKKRVQLRERLRESLPSAEPNSSEELHRSVIVDRLKRALVQQAVDWRDKGVVTPVYSQKLCGACWAFSTIETLETMNALKTGKLEALSVQEAIDCSKNDNQGCAGGDICSLLQWMFLNRVKIKSAADYPLKWKTNVCTVKQPTDGVGISEFSCNSYASNEKLILDTLANHGPVAVAINALTWQNYLGGVIHYHCDNTLDMLNHAAQIVGYNLNAEIPYYIVRNSWGENFGEKGYLKIAVGSNMCGLAHEVATLYV